MIGPEIGPERERENGIPDDVLATKIRPPRPSPHLLARPALFERLDEGTRGPLTLVCAPAGYGKTFLLVAWHASTTTPQATIAWISLDADDNDPIRFGTHLSHALGRASPGLGERSLAWLRSTQPPPLRSVLGPVINELNALANDIVLVLDDFHVINYTSVHDALMFLIDHAPTQLHLVLLVREDPPLTLARYRAQGALAEIRQADLRFSEQETAVFIGGVAGAQPDPDVIRVLAERTEGWAVGLQLAAIALRGHADPNRFVRSFGGTHRHVMDYLVEEVLAQQPLDIQS